jgi:Carboxypeptidase regulatory-like domain/Bacterial Ig domain
VSLSSPLLLVVLAAAAISGCLTGADDESEEPSVSAVTADPRLPAPPGHIVGYVRDVNGGPVADARVRLAGRRGGVRASRSGRFELRAGPGRRRVVADHPAYTRQSVTTTMRHGRGERVDFSLAVTAPDRVSAANSADRLIQWTSCDDLAGLDEGELRRWIRRGVDGFVCQTRHLPGLGSSHSFTGKRLPAGEAYALQRRLRRSPAVRRAREGKLLLYLGFWMSSFFNERTPLADWFDERAWSRVVLPRVHDLAAAARSMGFAGIAVDQELYPQEGNVQTASWSWRYRKNRHSEAEVRAKVKQRGRELMQTMVRAYPGLELLAYDTQHPQNWQAKVQAEVNELPDAFGSDVRIDLWDGLSSVEGYSAIRWMDAFFYKSPQLPGSSWDTALEYNANRIYSYLSRRLSNWSYASSRLHVSPFSWIDEGPGETEFDDARSPQDVAEQLEAFKRWGTGGAFANYAYEDLGDFDYRPFVDALRRASRPAVVDRSPPKLALTSPAPAGRRVAAGQTISLKGTASDNLGIRAVRWYDDRGRQGVARLTWNFSGDASSGWDGEMSWSVDNLRVPRGTRRITISAEDIKGLAEELSLEVTP